MGVIADSLFTVLMSWVRALVNGIWALFSSERTTILEFLGKNWIGIVLVIVVAGLFIDWVVWLVRWRPYHLFALRVRKWLHIDAPEEPRAARRETPQPQSEPVYQPQETWMPLEQPVIDEQDAEQVMRAAESVPDELLGRYPGMRYDSRADLRPEQDIEGTRRYSAVHTEGPGAAEVNRRRAEIDAWQLQMQEEARQRAQAERAAREAEQRRLAQEAYEAEQQRLAQEAYEAEQQRLAQEAYEAEQQRLAQEAYEAEQQRLAQEAYEAEQQRLAQEAYEAEQQRLAQEAYEAQLAEYERQKAQYERDLAEYERKKAEYDAAMARQAEAEPAQPQDEAPVESAGGRRRRRTDKTYSDYVGGEDVAELPDPPLWPQVAPETKAKPAKSAKPKREKKGFLRGSVAKMAQMIEPEEEEITGINALPPRVDPSTAYRPAKKPPKR